METGLIAAQFKDCADCVGRYGNPSANCFDHALAARPLDQAGGVEHLGVAPGFERLEPRLDGDFPVGGGMDHGILAVGPLVLGLDALALPREVGGDALDLDVEDALVGVDGAQLAAEVGGNYPRGYVGVGAGVDLAGLESSRGVQRGGVRVVCQEIAQGDE